MNLFEEMSNSTLVDVLRDMWDNFFNSELSATRAKEISDKLKISDIIALNQAVVAKDKSQIEKIINGVLSEYSIPGRTDIKSVASAPPVNKEKDNYSNGQENSDNDAPVSKYNTGGNRSTTINNISISNDDENKENTSNVIDLSKYRK
jgi:hypothetical protein